MGSIRLGFQYTIYVLRSKCLHAAKVVKLREKQNPDLQELGFSFQLDVFIDSCARGIMPNELELALPFIWPRLWSILLLKFWNSLVMLLVTIKTRIIPRHLQLAIRNDEELNKLLAGVTIAQGGVLPNIQAVLLPKKSQAAAAEKA